MAQDTKVISALTATLQKDSPWTVNYLSLQPDGGTILT